MGVERAVTRWYVIRQSLQEEIVRLEGQVARVRDDQEGVVHGEVSDFDQLADLVQQLAQARAKLQTLGPCPKPMMG